MAQLPPASHAASASQVAPLLTSGPSVPGLAPIRSTDGRAGVTTSWATSRRPVSTPLTIDTAKVTSWEPGAPGSSTTWRLMFIAGSSMRRVDGGSGMRAVTGCVRTRVTSICMPSVTGFDADGTTLSSGSNGAPAAASSRPTLSAAKRRPPAKPPSLMGPFFRRTSGVPNRQRLKTVGDSQGRRPHLPALLAVHRHLQRPAASQHDGVGLVDRLISGRIEIVVVTDGEAGVPHHVDHTRLHRRHRHR